MDENHNQPMQPPNNRDAEEAVLGSLLIDPDAILEVAHFLRPEHFYNVGNGWIYEAALSLHRRNEPIDILTLCEELRRRGRLDKVGGESCIIGLASAVPTSMNVEHYARIVEDTAVRRRLLKAAGDIAKLAHNGESDLDDSRAVLTAALETESGVEGDTIASVIDEIIRDYESGESAPSMHMPFFMTEDVAEAGFVIVGARPGMGKTAFLLHWVESAATAGVPVLVFSYEMSSRLLAYRMISQLSGVPLRQVKGRKGLVMDESRMGDYYTGAARLRELDIQIVDDRHTPPIDGVARYVERYMLRTGKRPMVFLDHLGLVNAPGKSAYEVTSVVSRELKKLAGRCRGVVAAAQLSRALTQRADHRPLLSDLRNSGNLEQDADAVLFPYRDDHSENAGDLSEFPNEVEVRWAKVRDDEPNKMYRFLWQGECVSFKPMAHEREMIQL